MGTPKRKTAAAVMRSPAQSLIGASVVIPPAIFPEDNAQYTGTVTGTPSRRKNAVYVKVDQDATQYWFPASEVSKWVVGENPATTASRTPKKARHQRQRPEDSSQQTPTASQTADVDDQTATQAEAPAELTVNNSPAPAAACLHDASSCHPQPHDDFTDTLEGLVCTCFTHQVLADHWFFVLAYQRSDSCRQPQVLRSYMMCLLLCKSGVSHICITQLTPSFRLERLMAPSRDLASVFFRGTKLMQCSITNAT